jgi:hypothetical protein
MTRRFWFISTSIAIHAGIGLGVFIAGVWQLDRLDRVQDQPLATVAMLTPPAPAGGPIDPPPVQIHKKVTKDLTQPAPKPKEDPKPSAPDPDPTPRETGAGGGGDGLDPKGKGPGGEGTCLTPPCGDAKATPPKPEPKVEETVTLPPNDFGMLRISGDTQIEPNYLTKNAMVTDGKRIVVAGFTICISETGAVTSVKQNTSSKYPSYDHDLDAAIHGWRYKPYEAKGHPMRACGTVTFRYNLQSIRR